MKKIHGLYLVTASCSVEELCRLVEQAIKGGVSIVQLRDKRASTEEVLQRAKRILPLLQAANIPLLINDHWSVAKRLGVGLHIGIEDGDPRKARDFLGPDAMLGITVHTQIERVFRYRDVVDYVGVGPVFVTQTKKDTRSVCGIDGLENMVRKSPVPVVAIGGIDRQNIGLLRAANPHAVAVCSAVCSAPEPTQAVLELIKGFGF